jgi:phage major head subunit gpT-like protein
MEQTETLAGERVAPVEAELFSASFVPGSWSDEKCTVDCVFYSGATVPRTDYWTGEAYELSLSLEASAVRLDRLNNGAPVCDNHNTFGSVMNQLGVVQRAWLEGGAARATLQFSPRAELAGLRADIKAGIIRSVSMGAWIYAKNDTTPKGRERKLFTAVDWEPYEISLTPVPADPGAVLMSAHEVVAAPAPAEAPARAISPEETEQMATTVVNPGEAARVENAAPPVVDTEALRAEGVQAERARATEIHRIAEPFRAKVGDQFVVALIDAGTSVADARGKLLEKLAAHSEAQPPTFGHFGGITRDAGDTLRENMTAALLHRHDPKRYPLKDNAGREFMGFSLLELGRICLNAKGNPMIGSPRDEVAFSALTTSDFPNILANVANKTLREGYQAAPRTFTDFCRQVSATDFKPVNRVQLSDLPALQPLNEAGEYHRTAPIDSKQTYSLATFGEVVTITRKTVINDDLGALTRIPFQLGVAAATLESNTVWAVITGNQVMMEDNLNLFIAGHKNLLTGANSALGVPALAAGRAAFRQQKGPKGTPLNLTPSFLIVPTALETAALQLIAPINLVATTDPTKVIPEWVRTLTPVIEPRLDAVSTTGWYLATRPGLIDTIEFCYLEGQDGVYIETRQGFDVDGYEIKARLDFAAAAIDYRGLQKNAGA